VVSRRYIGQWMKRTTTRNAKQPTTLFGSRNVPNKTSAYEDVSGRLISSL
jgi:hypothetical protein